ncbi:MAG TPA: MraY family glycosyltransferase, partial [Rhizomicrobium sp.]
VFVGDVSTIATYCVVSATLTAVISCCAQVFGRVTGLVDRPDGQRKTHEVDTPLIGGLALLVPSFAVSIVYLSLVAHAPFMVTAVAAASLMLIIGLADDLTGISPVWRLLMMMFLVFTTFSIEPIFVLHTLRLGVAGFSSAISLDPVAAPVTALVILGFINASNMADGMNGQLLGSIMIWCLFIALHLGLDTALPFIAVICSAGVTIIFNLRGRLFSGSSGAYAASLFIALGAIAAYRRGDGAVPAEMPLYWFWLPIVDCARLMVTRVLAGRSPLSGDRNHFHHMLHERGRMRYALIVYLGMLAAPGAAAEISSTLGSVVLLVCLAGYAAFVVARELRRADPAWPGAVASLASLFSRQAQGAPQLSAAMAAPRAPDIALQNTAQQANPTAGN